MANPTTERRTAAHQWLALVIGIVYLLVGIVGFFVTGFSGWLEHDHSQTLLGFAINPLHNVVHILIGALGLLMWSSPGRARTYGWILFVGYAAAAIYGFLVVNNEDANILNINMADNWLHVVSALAGLAIALWPRKDNAERRGRVDA